MPTTADYVAALGQQGQIYSDLYKDPRLAQFMNKEQADANAAWEQMAQAQAQKRMAQAQAAQAAQAQTIAPTVQEQAQTAQQLPQVQSQAQTLPTYSSDSLIDRASRTLSPLDRTGIALGSQLANFSNAYNVAKASGDQAGMDKAHADAEAYRSMMKNMGINIDGLGADATPEEKAAYVEISRQKLLDDTLGSMSADQFFNNKIDELVHQGYKLKDAKKEALRQAQQYRAQRTHDLTNAVFDYGISADGSMNPMGVRLMNLIYNDDPEAIAVMENAVPGLMARWKYDRNIEAMDKKFAQTKDMAAFQEGLTKDLNNNQADNQIRVQDNAGHWSIQGLIQQGLNQKEAITAQGKVQEALASMGIKLNKDGSISKYDSNAAGGDISSFVKGLSKGAKQKMAQLDVAMTSLQNATASMGGKRSTEQDYMEQVNDLLAEVEPLIMADADGDEQKMQQAQALINEYKDRCFQLYNGFMNKGAQYGYPDVYPQWGQ